MKELMQIAIGYSVGVIFVSFFCWAIFDSLVIVIVSGL